MTTVNNHVGEIEDPVLGRNPKIIWENAAPTGSISPWKEAPIGTIYIQRDDTNNVGRHFVKLEDTDSNYDWGSLGGLGVIQETFSYSDFTDGGATTGTLALSLTIPIGALVVKYLKKNLINLL